MFLGNCKLCIGNVCLTVYFYIVTDYMYICILYVYIRHCICKGVKIIKNIIQVENFVELTTEVKSVCDQLQEPVETNVSMRTFYYNKD